MTFPLVIVQVAPAPADALVPPTSARVSLDSLMDRVAVHGVWVKSRENALQIGLAVSVTDSQHNLHILLRNTRSPRPFHRSRVTPTAS